MSGTIGLICFFVGYALGRWIAFQAVRAQFDKHCDQGGDIGWHELRKMTRWP